MDYLDIRRAAGCGRNVPFGHPRQTNWFVSKKDFWVEVVVKSPTSQPQAPAVTQKSGGRECCAEMRRRARGAS